MPKLKTEIFGPGDLSWIGPDSTKAGRTEWLDSADAAFLPKVVGGVIPSGTGLALVGGQLKPYDAASAGDQSTLIGFLYTDQPFGGGRIGVPVFDRGRVNIAKLPGGIFVPPAPDKDATSITFVRGA